MTDLEKEKNNDVDNAINNFYRLKNEYESKYNNFKKQLLKNESISLKEKKQKLMKFKKKCVSCGKDGGTIFTIDKETLQAKCGNLQDSCNLDIKINRGDYDDLSDNIKLINDTINELKTEIIENKLNLLFQFSDETEILNLFKKQTSDINEFMDIYNVLMTRQIDIIENTKDKIELKKIRIEKSVILEKIKELIDEYKKEKKTSALKDAVIIYKTELYPLVDKETKIRLNHRYKYDDENIHKIVLKKNELCDLIYSWSNAEIIKNQVN